MIRTAVFYAATVASTAVFSLLGILAGLGRAGPETFDRVHRGWARSILRAAGVEVEVRGGEHLRREGGQILVANHQSIFDIWALMAALPVSLRFVAKAELARIPLLAGAMRAAGHAFIDRRRASHARAAIRAAGETMREDGLTLVLFPEGTRSPDGRLGRFRKGSFALAIEIGTVLVPAAVAGGARILPRGTHRIRPGRMTIRLAPPVPLDGLDATDRDGLVENTRAAVSGMLEEIEASERAGDASSAGPPEA